MKIKLDFVSNSSTTSFCMFGLRIDDNEIMDKIEDLEYEKLKGLSHYHDPYEDGGWIGRQIFHMKDDQTLRQFKEETLEMLKNLEIFENLTYESLNLEAEAWRDG